MLLGDFKISGNHIDLIIWNFNIETLHIHHKEDMYMDAIIIYDLWKTALAPILGWF